SDCLLIGDTGADVDAALRAGARAVLVPTAETLLPEVDRAGVLAEVAPSLTVAVRRTLRGRT
ncbi:MAG TPA: HAD hydrolase-like protein, partial [Propionibacteriaceae bacterium]|nr:HAD hydrolase-like protein [Propionibacteriaceae bacterium]